ncbi:MAG: hypothetical protein ISR90_04820 [Candidatus Marinimicrobia bacterium]|nr:hypothetical protein [Candidatus Neomarinimicrobiota bacterium]MBL7023360.1 hypothetical protein [Candidatus Neomarinimicrobiota bacterium]MBL7109319.1 hypothetical protein [Candidatus Neomarinimicrobiota bacterium]
MFDINLLKKPHDLKGKISSSAEEQAIERLKAKNSSKTKSIEIEQRIISKSKYVWIISTLLIISIILLMKFDKFSIFSKNETEFSQKDTIENLIGILVNISDQVEIDFIMFSNDFINLQINISDQQRLQSINKMYFDKFNKWATIFGPRESKYYLQIEIPWSITKKNSDITFSNSEISKSEIVSKLLELIELGYIFTHQLEIKKTPTNHYSMKIYKQLTE